MIWSGIIEVCKDASNAEAAAARANMLIKQSGYPYMKYTTLGNYRRHTEAGLSRRQPLP